jgi:hypothetical protein
MRHLTCGILKLEMIRAFSLMPLWRLEYIDGDIV